MVRRSDGGPGRGVTYRLRVMVRTLAFTRSEMQPEEGPDLTQGFTGSLWLCVGS